MVMLQILGGRSLLIGVILLLLNTIGAAHADSARQVWHASISEGYSNLESDTAKLSRTIESHCSQSNNQQEPIDLDTVKQSWLSAFLAWQAVRFVAFGPIEQNSRHWQLQFWPDTKNLVGRKVGYWLNNDKDITPNAIADSGVAIQGFPALEYVLFENSPARLSNRECELAKAITSHTHDVTQSLAEDWQRFGSFYTEQDRYLNTTVVSVVNALEILVDKRLADPMGLAGNTRRNPYLADAWRSGESLTALQASLEGLRDYFLPGLKRQLEISDQQALFNRFSEQLDDTLAEVSALPSAMKPLLEDDGNYSSLQSLFIEATQLRQLASGQMARELGIVKGFNSSDGD